MLQTIFSDCLLTFVFGGCLQPSKTIGSRHDGKVGCAFVLVYLNHALFQVGHSHWGDDRDFPCWGPACLCASTWWLFALKIISEFISPFAPFEILPSRWYLLHADGLQYTHFFHISFFPVRSNGLVDTVSARKFLEAADKTGDKRGFFTVFRVLLLWRV